MFLSWILDDIKNGIDYSFKELVSAALCGIAQIVCKILHAIERIYMYLLGAEKLPNDDGKSIFDSLFQHSTMQKCVYVFLSVAGGLWIISTILGFIKGMANQDSPNAVKKTIRNAAKGLLGIVIIPFFCCCVYMLSVRLVAAVVAELGGTNNPGLADSVWKAGHMGCQIEDSTYLQRLYYYGTYGKYSTLTYRGMNFFSLNSTVHFDYFVVIVGGVALGFSMSIATIKLVSRIINLMILYVFSPVVVSTMSVDDGIIFETWKEISIAKLFSVIGSVLAMYIYLVFLQIVSDIENKILNTGKEKISCLVLFST